MSVEHGGGENAFRHVNEVGEAVADAVVQARDIRGGVHLHTGAAELPPPRQLPGTGSLVDRAEALRTLDRIGDRPPRVVVVSGPAGVGKTAVALRWAHRRLEEFPDGQLYADLQGHAAVDPALPGEVLAGFIRGLGVAAERVPAGLAERAALYRSLTAGRRLLVVLDDAYSVAQVVPLLPGSAGSVAVVTSRRRLAVLMVRGARGVQLGPLTQDAALELLAEVLGADRVAREPGMAARLAELCACSPLALSVAAARLVTRPHRSLAEMVDALAGERRRLKELTLPDADDEMTVRAALALSYQGLSEPVRHLYRLLGSYPGRTFGVAAAAALTGAPPGDAAEWLDELADANLLEDLPGARYRLHDLTRLHAMELGEAAEPEALARLTAWTVQATLAASGAVAPYRRLAEPEPLPDVPPPPEFTSAAEALTWLEEEFGNLRALADRAHRSGLHRPVWQLVDAAWPLFLHRRYHAHRLAFDSTGLAAARADGDRRAEAKMLNRTGLARRDQGDLDGAARDFQAAHAIWHELGDRARMAGTDRRLGLLAVDRHDPAAAEHHHRAALAVYRLLADDRHVALTICDFAAVLIDTGRAAEADALLEEARGLLAARPDPYNQARVLILLGRARMDGPAREEARALLDRGLAVMREIGSAAGEAGALRACGDLARRDGRTGEADRCYEQARRILAGAGAPAGTPGEQD
ncbi:ATP-binding protein [Actinomadura macrotermitis]|uniref:Regulatory protein AfsR n=1 Tax=Actinomadura macrotermitis TaxID=2585200 RepID=A0A7K0BZF3_9ACTN|nr:NB-ARC domain-containing protein [Actinomadura macrotermitis]MQY06560.1 Regulatory protein AfsR [Actinomadura macrotermitis]